MQKKWTKICVCAKKAVHLQAETCVRIYTRVKNIVNRIYLIYQKHEKCI